MHWKNGRMEDEMSSKDLFTTYFILNFVLKSKIFEDNNDSLDLIILSLILDEKAPKPWYSVQW